MVQEARLAEVHAQAGEGVHAFRAGEVAPLDQPVVDLDRPLDVAGLVGVEEPIVLERPRFAIGDRKGTSREFLVTGRNSSPRSEQFFSD